MRLRRRGFRGKGLRPHLMWFRQAGTTTTLGIGTPLATPAVSAFSGTLVDAGLDSRLTLRRMHIQLGWSTGNNLDDGLFLRVAVAMLGNGEPVPNPLLLTQNDRQKDYLTLRTFPLTLDSARLGSANVGISPAELGYSTDIDIKSMRKVDQDEALALVYALGTYSGGALANPDAVQVYAQVSSLFQRTGR